MQESREPRYALRFLFDYASESCLWGDNDLTYNRFGINVDPSELPLSPATISRIGEMSQWFQTSLDLDDPAGPSPWQQEERDRFNEAAATLYETIKVELGNMFEVTNQKTLITRVDTDGTTSSKTPRRWYQRLFGR